MNPQQVTAFQKKLISKAGKRIKFRKKAEKCMRLSKTAFELIMFVSIFYVANPMRLFGREFVLLFLLTEY